MAKAILIVLLLAGHGSNDAFVQMMEQRQGMTRGQTKVVPECGCTIRYLGTRINGRRYEVIIEKLD